MREVELKPFLTTEWVKGRILSLDALQTQRELCAQVHRLQGDYLLIAKDNQPTLREDIVDFFEDSHAFPETMAVCRDVGPADMDDSNIARSCAVLI